MPLVHYHSESVLTYFVCAADLAALSTSCKFRLFPEQTCTLGFPARRKWDLSVPLTHACHISGASCGTRLHKRGQRKKMLFKQCGGDSSPPPISIQLFARKQQLSVLQKQRISQETWAVSALQPSRGTAEERQGRCGAVPVSLPPSHTSLQSQGTQSAT